MVANILPADPLLPPPDPGVVVKMSKLLFSEHGYVAYQIKGNHGCSNMVTHIMTALPPPDPGGQTIKIQLLCQNDFVIRQGL